VQEASKGIEETVGQIAEIKKILALKADSDLVDKV
jgi:hypothetical protein